MRTVRCFGALLALVIGCGGGQPPFGAHPKQDVPSATRAASPPSPSPGVIGVVDGGYPIFGAPPSFEPWPAAAGLEQSFDVAPVSLDDPIPEAVGLLLVPLINALDQSRLDALASAIDSGIPAIIIADPFSLQWLEPAYPPGRSYGTDLKRMRAHNVGSEGDAVGLLRAYGFEWDELSVLEQTRQPRNERLVDIVEVRPANAGDGLPELVGIYPGRLQSKDDRFEPLLIAPSEVVSKPAAFHHPGGEVEFDDSGPPTSLEPPVVFAARTSATGRADVTVIADQDLFADPLQGERTSDLLAQLAGRHIQPTKRASFDVGARLLAVDPSAVASIELVERSPGVEVEAAREADTDPYSAAFVGSARRARARAERDGHWAIQRWIRLRRSQEQWVLDSGDDRDVESPAPVSRLLQAFVEAKLMAVPRPTAPAETPREGPPSTLRVVMRDATGSTLLDVVLEPSTDEPVVLRARGSERRFAASLDFESDLETFEKSLRPSVWKDRGGSIELGEYGVVGKGDGNR